MGISGSVAIVTGASSGIGRATAVHLAREGARVMAVARRRARLEELADETGAEFVVADLASEPERARVVEETRERLGPVGILVNNAGGGSADGSVRELATSSWREMMNLNVEAPFELTRSCAPDMVERGWGRVVMVSSTAGEVGAPNMVAFCSSKHALIGLTRAAAADLAPFGVTCNAVLPGWVRTEATDRSAARESAATGDSVEEIWARREASYPSGRVVTAEEVASAIALLCSDECSGVSGQAVTVALGGLW